MLGIALSSVSDGGNWDRGLLGSGLPGMLSRVSRGKTGWDCSGEEMKKLTTDRRHVVYMTTQLPMNPQASLYHSDLHISSSLGVCHSQLPG